MREEKEWKIDARRYCEDATSGNESGASTDLREQGIGGNQVENER